MIWRVLKRGPKGQGPKGQRPKKGPKEKLKENPPKGPKGPKEFTGTCPVRQHTADGDYVGRCYHSTYGGHCHLHGDVSRFLGEGADLHEADDMIIGVPIPTKDQSGVGSRSGAILKMFNIRR